MSFEAFDYIKYTYIFFIIILLALFIKTIFIKNFFNYINAFSVVSVSIICLIVSSFNLIFLGYASDELNFNIIQYTYMFIMIAVLSVINSILSYRNNK